MDFESAKDKYELADAAWGLLPLKTQQREIGYHHERLAKLAAACRDAATTEQDRCRWDIRWHAHFVNSGRVAPLAPPKPVKARPEQMSLF